MRTVKFLLLYISIVQNVVLSTTLCELRACHVDLLVHAAHKLAKFWLMVHFNPAQVFFLFLRYVSIHALKYAFSRPGLDGRPPPLYASKCNAAADADADDDANADAPARTFNNDLFP